MYLKGAFTVKKNFIKSKFKIKVNINKKLTYWLRNVIVNVKKAPTPKWMPTESAKCPYGHRQSCWQTGLAILFLLIDVGKQGNQKRSKEKQ